MSEAKEKIDLFALDGIFFEKKVGISCEKDTQSKCNFPLFFVEQAIPCSFRSTVEEEHFLILSQKPII